MSAFHRRPAALILSLSLILCLSACGSSQVTPTPTAAVSSMPTAAPARAEMTQRLIKILEENPNVKKLLQKSIDAAKKINPDPLTNPAQSLEEYYDYIDWACTAMPWNISKNVKAEGLYEKIDQSLNYFYFINDQPLDELEGQGLYNNSLQYAEPYRSWLIEFTRAWGEYLSTPESWNEEYYQLAYADERFGLQTDWYESPDNWTTFNEFFSRRLSSTDQRPIAAVGDNSVVVSPADSTPQGVWQIDENSMIVQKANDKALIKSREFDSIAALIGPNSKYKDAFGGGVLTHTFLDVHDYHRYHFPVSGTILEVTHIPQDDAVGGYVTWDEESGSYILNAETPGWQMIETRDCVIMQTEDYGLVALLPIGMSQVSSVNFEDTVKVGATVKKGDALGYFLFGGSDFVIIFQKEANFQITAPSGRDETYDHIFMGQEYGILGQARS